MVVRLEKALKKVLFTGITGTTTSAFQESKGQNAIILYANFTAGSGTWTVKVQGRYPNSVDTYVDAYDHMGYQMKMNAITASRAQLFVGLPDDFKIVATEDVNGATIDVAYELITV